jgi:glyoxylase-like metal-dependent hydrolase (beta-lactamase superfamily II)
MSFPGLPPLRAWEAEHTIAGGETLDFGGTKVDVIFTPGHSIGHVTYSLPDHGAMFSGDVIFKGSVGRTDLPGGDPKVLLDSIARLVDSHDPETVIYPGHMEQTTLGEEKSSNPFLVGISS